MEVVYAQHLLTGENSIRWAVVDPMSLFSYWRGRVCAIDERMRARSEQGGDRGRSEGIRWELIACNPCRCRVEGIYSEYC